MNTVQKRNDIKWSVLFVWERMLRNCSCSIHLRVLFKTYWKGQEKEGHTKTLG